jgi:hypothetical protein|tara:strand:- start:1142 stop:1339 length:198 start_codon:yes stop_codon:yes gene_type:complete
MQGGTDQKPSTPEENEPSDTSLKDPLVPVLMLLGVIAATLSVIVAGYIHGNMHIEAVYKSLTQFT